MKKLLLLTAAAVILFSPLSYADRDDYGRGGYGGWGHHEHEHHHRHYQPHYQPGVRYYQQPPVVYYPQPPVRYYAQPQVPYYPQPQPYSGNSLHLSW